MGYHLGVDLGTTFTAAAIERDGRVDIVPLGNHAATIPSMVYFRQDDDVLIGDAAERRGMQEPARLAREFKRRFGDSTPILLDRTPVSADRLTGMMLRHIVADVYKRQGGAADSVGLAHPANWGQFKIDLLRQAVELAGLGHATFVSEPVAAAVQYAATERVDVGDVVAVYDLGGGTFDAAVLRKTATGFDTLGQPQGIERLGGIDFDESVFAHVRRAVGDSINGLDTSEPTVRASIARVRYECVLAKEALSSDSEATIPVMLPHLQTQVRITRGEFEDMIRPTLRETIETLRRAITMAGIDIADVRSVVLAGGSSRIPLVSELLRTELGRPTVTDAHPKHAVAMGAARMAAHVSPVRTATAPTAVAAPAVLVALPPQETVVQTPRTPSQGAAVPRAARHRRLVAVAALGVLLVGAGVAVAMTRSSSGQQDSSGGVGAAVVVVQTTVPGTATTPTTTITDRIAPPAAVATSAPQPTEPATTPTTVAVQTTPVTAPPTVPQTALVPPPVGVPNVFGLAQSEAEVALVNAGYVPHFFRVCSGSVAEGEVRQVLWSDGANEFIVVDKQGVIPEQALLPPGSELSVKVGTGQPCN